MPRALPRLRLPTEPPAPWPRPTGAPAPNNKGFFRRFAAVIAVKLVFCITLFTATPAVSDVPSADAGKTQFKLGLQAFQDGHFDQAVNYFQQARNAGLNDKRLEYNLGMAFYKLGRYQQAIDALTQAAENSDLRAMAYINMGLAAIQLQDSNAALNYLQSAYHASGNDKQKKLVLLLVDKARDVQKNWSAVARLDLGHNSNVILREDETELIEEGLGGDDAFASLFMRAGLNMPYRQEMAFSIYQLQYNRLNEHDYTNAAFSYAKNMGVLNIGIGIEQDFLGRELFLNEASLSLRLHYRFKPWAIQPFISAMRFFNVAEEYDYLGGQMQRAGARLFWRGGGQEYALQIQREWNQRQDIEETDRFVQDFSPARSSVELTGFWPVWKGQWKLGIRYRYSRHSQADLLASGENRIRTDRRLLWHTEYDLPLSRSFWLVLQWYKLDNDSNITVHEYDSSRLSIGVVWRY